MGNTWFQDFVNKSMHLWPPSPEVLEAGTGTAGETVRSLCAPRCSGFTRTAPVAGAQVDVVADPHELDAHFTGPCFDVLVAHCPLGAVEDWAQEIHRYMSLIRLDGCCILLSRAMGASADPAGDEGWRLAREDGSPLLNSLGSISLLEEDEAGALLAMVIQRKADQPTLDMWRAQAGACHKLFNTRANRRITLGDYRARKLLELPFDQYQRYRIIRDCLDHLDCGGKSAHILDVGGWPGTLQKFVPQARVTITDLQVWEGKYVRADGCCLPFRDAAFDAAVSSDTLEHIPPGSRSAFVEELMRVSRGPVLMGAPFDDPAVVHAEEVLQQLIETHYHEKYDFIEEHRTFGLPDLAVTESLFRDRGFQTAVLPNGYLDRWLIALSTFFLLQWRYHDPLLSARANVFYNHRFYRADMREPSYRKLVVASRSRDLSGLKEAICPEPESHGKDELLGLQTLNLFVNVLREGWSIQAQALKKKLVEMLEMQHAQVMKRMAHKEGKKKANRKGWRTVRHWIKDSFSKDRKEPAPADEAAPSDTALGPPLPADEAAPSSPALGAPLPADEAALAGPARGAPLPAAALPAARENEGGPDSFHAETLWQNLKSHRYKLRHTPCYGKRDPGKYDIVLMPIIDWHFRFQRPQQLARLFARAGHRVFYLKTNLRSKKRSKEQKVDICEVEDNIFTLQFSVPSRLNLYKDELDEDAVRMILGGMKRLRDSAGIFNAVCKVDLPFWTPLAQALRERWGWKLVYDCMDDHSGFTNNRPSMLSWEETLIARSDLVVTTAHRLYQKVKPRARKTLLVPNAAEFNHFNARPGRQPLAHLKGPVIGYYGAISDWFDTEMVLMAAVARPEWNFVLIGSTLGADVAALGQLPNVHLLGEIDYKELPAYLHGFHVACIPFKINALTEATNPVKFYEYLSAGKPVVSVRLPELGPYEGFYHPVNSPEDFVSTIEVALEDQEPEQVEARIRLARENDWSARFQILKASLDRFFPRAVIVIVSYNNLDYLDQCLQSIWEKTDYPDYSVVVVDNASEAPVRDYLEDQARMRPRLQVILNDENLGFARANNQGIRAAGECGIVALLNNDTVVTRGWLTRLAYYLSNPQIGMVGSVTNWAGNEARVEVDYEEIRDMDAFAEKYTAMHEGRCFEIPMLAMYCVAMRRSVVDQVGVLDERYERGMFEDDDFALRLRNAGYRIVCAEDVFVHHWGRASFGALEQAEYDRIFQANKARFEEKWGRPWVAHTYRSSSRSSVKQESPRLFDPDRVKWQCNLCGAPFEGPMDNLRPEKVSCPSCRSTVRMRGLVRVLSLELFGKNLMLADFPENKKLRGMGLSDWLGYAETLAQKLDYTNTYLDRAPRLDITEPDPAMEGTLDFLISSDVFEHIAPPVSRAFDNAYKLLKPGGVLVLTVPYSLKEATSEHFPDLHDYEVVEEGGEKILKNVTRDGREQVFRDLVYHGGEGATLEMRVFCKEGLLHELDRAGFTQVRIHDTPFMDNGIYWYFPKSLPLSARKPAAKDGAS